jgi:hypothetical protein
MQTGGELLDGWIKEGVRRLAVCGYNRRANIRNAGSEKRKEKGRGRF